MFQEVEFLRFRNIRYTKVVNFSALRTAAFSPPPHAYSLYSFLLEAEPTPGPQWGRKDYEMKYHKGGSSKSAREEKQFIKVEVLFVISCYRNNIPWNELVVLFQQKLSIVFDCIFPWLIFFVSVKEYQWEVPGFSVISEIFFSKWTTLHSVMLRPK